MEIGAFFLLVILLIVLAVCGAAVYGVAAWLRRDQLDPEENKLESGPEERQPQPEHVKVETEQRAHFVGERR
jgi:hypothetical protein